MEGEWSENQPIYRQLRDMIVAMIIDGTLSEGDALPSVRQVAAGYRVNPITVLKSYQQLVDEVLVEKRRGIGMFVMTGARNAALRSERDKFLAEDWPGILESIKRLGLSAEELLERAAAHRPRSKAKGGR